MARTTATFHPREVQRRRLRPHRWRTAGDPYQCIRCNLPEDNTVYHVEVDALDELLDVQALRAGEREPVAA